MKIYYFKIIISLFILYYSTAYSQEGCTDVLANNFSQIASVNNGSCTYDNTIISPYSSLSLNNVIKETSGLIEWNNQLYTQNDDTDTNLYKLEKSTGNLISTLAFPSITNIDWEEISQDENYIYIGDFGNNVSGNRTNLKIYKISKNSIDNPIIETINFSYFNQHDFAPKANNSTDFDCEAFVVTDNEILLFTKQWNSQKTTIYSLSKSAGTHTAIPLYTLDVSGLITGATLVKNLNIIVLSGYSNKLFPFVFMIYDFKNNNFANANKRKIHLNLPFHQIESISSSNGTDYFLTNEEVVVAPYINNIQKLHKISLQPFLENYIFHLSVETNKQTNNSSIFHPNPVEDVATFKNNEIKPIKYRLMNTSQQLIEQGVMKNNQLNMVHLKPGIYFVHLINENKIIKLIKK